MSATQIMLEALEKIACLDENPPKPSMFDEPVSVRTAREALAKLKAWHALGRIDLGAWSPHCDDHCCKDGPR